jgi:hypothetical protein
MEFEAYLTSKRIDSARFAVAEPQLWQSWKSEFENLHPNSFTVQKLNLINPIRRKYQLIVIEPPKPPVAKPAVAPVVKPTPVTDTITEKPAAPVRVVPKIPRPGMPKAIPGVPPEQKISAPRQADETSKTPEPAEQTSSMPEQATTQSETEHPTTAGPSTAVTDSPPPPPKPKPVIPRPVMKPKPKTE